MDILDFFGSDIAGYSASIFEEMFVSFQDDTMSALGSEAIPDTITLSDWENTHMARVIFVGLPDEPEQVSLDFEIHNLERVSSSECRVPDPGNTLILIAMFFVALVGAWRRYR